MIIKSAMQLTDRVDNLVGDRKRSSTLSQPSANPFPPSQILTFNTHHLCFKVVASLTQLSCLISISYCRTEFLIFHISISSTNVQMAEASSFLAP